MWNEPTDEELRRLPELYSTEHVSARDKMIHMHFFLGGCDWYVAEYGRLRREFFGFAIFNDDLQNAEWGSFSYDELRSVRVGPGFEVDRDLNWRPRKASDVERIARASGW